MDIKRCTRYIFLALSVLSFSFFLHFQTRAQLIVQNNLTPEQLVQQVLVGGGITVLNVTYTGSNLPADHFLMATAPTSELMKALVLSSGSIFHCRRSCEVFCDY